MQKIFCAMCGEQAFNYNGRIEDGPKSALATFPDGAPVIESTLIRGPCGHHLRNLRDMRIEEVPN